ncbi:DNA cytosine methyltransferase [Flavobacterium lipolyticum]|uniref:DNA (cytosine-5-)-methyltransferase n=1 Tax=Flavobacterium lipolyticum TaxID=2893754 RepID=A0ABS8LX22_9FLAO|nr:DNA cytosine methyltransferase [Flavobacterium sp. F-126]MCC9016954.1 DNA cytosine methyltransferase [Flavobacterium sp. F-126]
MTTSALKNRKPLQKRRHKQRTNDLLKNHFTFRERAVLNMQISIFITYVKTIHDVNDFILFWFDLFCGAGGTSTGIHHSGTKSIVASCVNHDFFALAAHARNHPHTLHFREDIRDFKVVIKLRYFAEKLQRAFPNSKLKLWASLECTNYSKAKGGQARDADSRSLADHMPMYLEHLNLVSFWIENVREFMSWGPLDENGKPESRTAGKDYIRWIKKIESFGFKNDHKVLNAANYGSYQSRERLFVQFVSKGYPVAWPEQTHTKDQIESTLFPMDKWKAVKEVLNLEDEGKSIFDRKKPLANNTLDVIAKGIAKAIKENESTFIFKYYGTGDNYSSINKTSGTVTCNDRFAIIQLIFNQYKTGHLSSIDKPSGAVTCNPKQNILTFILNPSHGGHTTSIDKSSPTIIARQDKAPLYILKAIMGEYGIVDIKMRMMQIPELLQIQGFPKHYKLYGNQKHQKKQIGNAVDVWQAKAISKCTYDTLEQYLLETAA